LNNIYFDHIINRVKSAKIEADSLSRHVKNHTIEGQIREIALKRLISPFMTQSFKSRNGKIIDTEGRLTGQIDLILYRSNQVIPILIDDELGFFPVECVKYAIEVKSRLTSNEIRKTLNLFKTVSSLNALLPNGSEGGPLPVTVLFAFGSDIKGSEIERLKKMVDTYHSPITTFCVLGKGYWLYDPENREWYGKDTSKSKVKFSEFCNFMTGMMNTLASSEMTFSPI
jgi:hypothetical protein